MRTAGFGPVVVGCLCAATRATAQDASHAPTSLFSLGITAGASMPTGFTGEAYRSGYQLGALAELRSPVPWLAMRLDGGYQDLGRQTYKLVNSSGSGVGDFQLASALASGALNLVLRLPNATSAIHPYVLGGVGSYWLRTHTSAIAMSPAHNGSTRVNGVDAGFGMDASVSRVTMFTELRYQRVGSAPLRFVPISVGVRLP